jgi:hypothetical protein
LQLRKDFGHSVQPWLTPIPGSLFDEECLLVSIIAFLRLPQIIPEFLGKFNYEHILIIHFVKFLVQEVYPSIFEHNE